MLGLWRHDAHGERDATVVREDLDRAAVHQHMQLQAALFERQRGRDIVALEQLLFASDASSMPRTRRPTRCAVPGFISAMISNSSPSTPLSGISPGAS